MSRVEELYEQNSELQHLIGNYTESIARAHGKIEALQRALPHAERAHGGARDLCDDRYAYFSQGDWAGRHADSFRETIGDGSRGSCEAEALRDDCQQLVSSITTAITAQEQIITNKKNARARCQNEIHQNRRIIGILQASDQ